MKGTFVERQKKPKKPKDDEEAKKRRKAAKEQARALAQQNNPGGVSGGSECYLNFLFYVNCITIVLKLILVLQQMYPNNRLTRFCS